VSALLCVATSALWVRSYWISDTVYDTTERVEGEWYVRGSKRLFSNRGAFTFSTFGRWESMDGQPDYAKALLTRRFGGIDPPRGWTTYPAEDLSGWFKGEPDRGAIGFRWRTSEERKQLDVIMGLKRIHVWQQQLVIPDWGLLLIFAGFPTLRIRDYLKSRRKVGHCASCGYDLRATPDRCPECGTVPSEKIKIKIKIQI
jgi:hypothetical protein